MIYTVRYSKAFQKGLKKLKHNEKALNATKAIISQLANGEILPEKHKDHQLKGEFEGLRECHILPDLLLIYQKQESELILLLIALGSHSELF